MDSVHHIALVVAIAGGACVLALIYFNASVNAHADREDAVVSVPGALAGIEELGRAIAAAAGQPAIPGNTLTLFQNGEEIFPAMLECIARAESTVHFVSYVFRAGVIPGAFADAFSSAAQRGVEVRIVIDRDGAKSASPKLLAQMRGAGCDVQWFRPARWYDWEEYNRRTHRRLLIVDGDVGFTGGVGIADEWSGAGDSPCHWRDTQARILGPAVASLERVRRQLERRDGRATPRGGLFPAPCLPGQYDDLHCAEQSSECNEHSPARRRRAHRQCAPIARHHQCLLRPDAGIYRSPLRCERPWSRGPHSDARPISQ
ncbi:MAG: phospholipase D-like domain-containing protein [Gemmatimonadota bacterium]|nr:phospholipase D-like domain-containing protein [Gemmatimonadota bacterium]